MQKKLQQARNKEGGFTIIEVLIVLAIAGLILLIVFLAVPALQRNSRNTTAKNDAQNVLGGVTEFRGANDGKNPTGVSGSGTVNFTGPAGTNATSIKVQGNTNVVTVSADTAVTDLGTINVYPGRKCASDTTTTSSTRSVAVFYGLETSSATLTKCADS